MQAVFLGITWYFLIIFQIIFINIFSGGGIINLPLIFALFLNWKFPNPSMLWWTTFGIYLLSFFDGMAFEIIVPLVWAVGFLTQYLILNVLTHRTTGSAVLAIIIGLFIYDALLALLYSRGYADILGSWQNTPLTLYLLLQFLAGAIVAAASNSLIKKYEAKQISLLG